MATDGRRERLTKKELARLEKERGKLEKNLRGHQGHAARCRDAVFVIDTQQGADRGRRGAQARDPGRSASSTRTATPTRSTT